MYTDKLVLSFLESYARKNDLEWVNSGRVSDDWKARLYEQRSTLRQFAIYDREIITVRFESDVPAQLKGALRLPKCAGGDALKHSRSHFVGGSGVCYSVEDAEVLGQLLDIYFQASGGRQLSEFAAQFESDVDRALKRTRKERRQRLASAPKKPRRMEVTTTVFLRNPDVVAEVTERAKGHCESCSRPAPFTRARNNTPYLEVHHRVPLALDGEDTVENAIALCPNCHRQRHYG